MHGPRAAPCSWPQECAHLFSTSMPNFTAVVDSHMQAIAASHLTPRDAVLYYSYSGSTEELLKNLKIVRERKAMAILITPLPQVAGGGLCRRGAPVRLPGGPSPGGLRGGPGGPALSDGRALPTRSAAGTRPGAPPPGEIVAEVLSDKHI